MVEGWGMAHALTRRRGGIGGLMALLAMLAWVWVAAVCPPDQPARHDAPSVALHAQHGDHGLVAARLDLGCSEVSHADLIPQRAPPAAPLTDNPSPLIALLSTFASLFEATAVPNASIAASPSPPRTLRRFTPLGAQAPPARAV